jgi:glucokinase
VQACTSGILPGLAIGVDIGGTKIAAGMVDVAGLHGAEGRVLAREVSHAHAGQPPDRVIAAIVDLARPLAEQARAQGDPVTGVGMGFPGYTDGARGRALYSSNLPDWDNYPLRDRLQELLGLPAALDNDCNCAAWAEYHYGAGRGSRNMCYVTLSTGLGAGIVIDGQIYAGAMGMAGEVGHIVMDPEGPLCTCGRRGCAMAYASGVAISRMVCERIRDGEPTLLHRLGDPLPSHVSGEAVAQAAQQGDRVASEILSTVGRYFGLTLLTVVETLNPERIVIGGGLARIGTPVIEPALQTLREYLHPLRFEGTQIVLSELWEDAGMIGAAALLRAPDHG